MESFRGSASEVRMKMAERIEALEEEVKNLKGQLQEVGHIIELDPDKWYWMVVDMFADIPRLEEITKEDGRIIFTSDLKAIKFVENPDRLKGVLVVQNFDEVESDVG